MAKIKEYELIDMKDLKDYELLRTYVIYSDQFAELPEDQKRMIYCYCKCHANYPACVENLNQIRYAVTRMYFGW